MSFIFCDEIMTHKTTSISCWKTIHDRMTDVEVLTGTAVGVCIAGVAERGTGIDVVFVNEREAHDWVIVSQYSRQNGGGSCDLRLERCWLH